MACKLKRGGCGDDYLVCSRGGASAECRALVVQTLTCTEGSREQVRGCVDWNQVHHAQIYLTCLYYFVSCYLDGVEVDTVTISILVTMNEPQHVDGLVSIVSINITR